MKSPAPSIDDYKVDIFIYQQKYFPHDLQPICKTHALTATIESGKSLQNSGSKFWAQLFVKRSEHFNHFFSHSFIHANRHVHTMSSICKQLTSEKLQLFMPTDMTIVEFLLLPLILFMHSQPLSLRRCAQYLFHILFFCWCFCFSFIIFVPAFGEKCNATAGNNSLTTHLARSRQLATNTFLCTATNLRIFSSNNFSFAYFTLLHCLLFVVVVVGRSLCLPVGGDSFAAL